MTVRRLLVVVGMGGVVAGAAVIACSGTGDTTNVFAVADAETEAGDAGARDASATDGPYFDAFFVPDDAPYDGPGCENDQSPTSNRCDVVRRCTSSECSAKDSVVYECFDAGGGVRPPIEGCTSLRTQVNQREQWCCPAACVPKEPGNASNCPGQTIYTCAAFDGGPSGLPGPFCTLLFNDPPTNSAAYCCP